VVKVPTGTPIVMVSPPTARWCPARISSSTPRGSPMAPAADRLTVGKNSSCRRCSVAVRRYLLLAACAVADGMFGAAAFIHRRHTCEVASRAARRSSRDRRPPGHMIYQIGCTGITTPAESGYRITWNVKN
jgi:hypothetical protein